MEAMTQTAQDVRQPDKPGLSKRPGLSGQTVSRVVTATVWGILLGITYYTVFAFAVRLATHASVSPATWGSLWNEWTVVEAGLGALTFASLSWALCNRCANRRNLKWRGLLAGLICAVVLSAFTMAVVFGDQPYWSAAQVLGVLGLFVRITAVAAPAMSLLGLLSGLSW